jgi:hypothetical protein
MNFFYLVRIGQIFALHCSAIFGKRIPKDSKKEWWSFDYFSPFFSPRTFVGGTSSWERWPVVGRAIIILTLSLFFHWKV